jgi:hypothetical protein
VGVVLFYRLWIVLFFLSFIIITIGGNHCIDIIIYGQGDGGVAAAAV